MIRKTDVWFITLVVVDENGGVTCKLGLISGFQIINCQYLPRETTKLLRYESSSGIAKVRSGAFVTKEGGKYD